MPSEGQSPGASPQPGHQGPDYASKRPVAHFVTEYWPYARTGGLAEAVHGVANQLQQRDVDTSVVLPLYPSVRPATGDLDPVGEPFDVQMGDRVEEARLFQARRTGDGPRVFFVESREYFDRDGIYGERGTDYPDNHRRFGFFCRAALQALPRISPDPPLLHAHDWHTSLAPVFLGTILAGDPYYDAIPRVLSVHNAGFQGHFGPEVLPELGLSADLLHWTRLEWYGKVNFLKGGLVYSDMITTVSPGHAHELRTPGGGFGLHDTFIDLQDRFHGILNGIDLHAWDPATDPALAATYSPQDMSGKAECKRWLQRMARLEESPGTPLCCMSARMVQQKGIDLILGADLLQWDDVQYVFLGSGQPNYEEALAALAASSPGRIVTRFDFTDEREHTLLAGADILLMPSLYEPCGLTQMRAQRYGVLPVARRVGGLADTVDDQVTGFLFDEYSAESLERALRRAIGLYEDQVAWSWHVQKAMSRDFGWGRSAERYLRIYGRAEARRAREM